MVLWTPQVEDKTRTTLEGSRPSIIPVRSPVQRERERQQTNILDSAVQTVGKHILYENRRRKALRDRQAVASSVLAYRQGIGYTLQKEMGKFYRSDGSFVSPQNDYRGDLGWGISLSRDDFYRDGKRRPHLEIFRDKSAEFIQMRKGNAPSQEALTLMELGLKEQELRQTIVTNDVQNKWTINSVSVAANDIVRSFKEQLSLSKGYDPTNFALHLKAINDVISPAGEFADPGALQQTFRLAVTDMVAAGVAEAGNAKDNTFALEVLGHSPLRNSAVLKQAMAGLSGADRAYFQRVVGQFTDGRKLFKYGQPAPENVRLKLDWALAQVDPAQLDKIHNRALRSFNSQTNIARQNVSARIKGILNSVVSPSVNESGFREELKNSIAQGMRDVSRIYPKDLYPLQHAKNSAALLVGSELLNIRNTFNQTPSHLMPAMTRQLSHQVRTMMTQKLGQNEALTASESMLAADQAIQAMAKKVVTRRQGDPFGSLIMENKALGGLEQRLQKPYSSHARKAEDQDALKRMVELDAVRKGVAVSFMTGFDKSVIQNFLLRGHYDQGFKEMARLRNKYGDAIYFDYIAPEIASMQGLDADVGAGTSLGLFRNPGVASYFTNAKSNYGVNVGLLKKQNPDMLKNLEGLILERFDEWETIQNTVEGRLGRNATSEKVLGDIGKMIREMSVSKAITGNYPRYFFKREENEAMEASLKLFLTGMGGGVQNRVIEFEGVSMLAPPALSEFNDLEISNLEDAVRNENFLMERVFPRIQPNAYYSNLSQQSGTSIFELYMRDFLNEDLVHWAFTEEGIRPMYTIPELGISGAFVDSTNQTPLTILYNELPAIVVTDRFLN